MKKSFDLNKMGLVPMTGEEMQEIDGGLWYEVGAVVFGVVAIFATGGIAGAAAGISFCCTMLAAK